MRAAFVLKHERLGLLVVAAALLAILAVCVLLVRFEVEHRTTELRAHGTSLVRVLSNYGFTELVNPGPDERSPLRILEQTGLPDSFAYVAILDLNGAILTKLAEPGISIQPAPLESDPSYWLGERLLPANDGSPRIREFHAPILKDRRHAGYLRAGFVDPGYGHLWEFVPLFARVALVVFMLVPIYHLPIVLIFRSAA